MLPIMAIVIQDLINFAILLNIYSFQDQGS